MIVVAIIALLAAIAIPNYSRARQRAQQRLCVVNLTRIDGVIEEWALDAKKRIGDPVTYNDIRGYLKEPVACPSGGAGFTDSYEITKVDDPPACMRVTAGDYAHKFGL
jgi:type II secretory pathway pseudopilin PulG